MDPLEYLVPGRKRLPYGMMNFAVIRREDYYYVDKTRFIPMIEQAFSSSSVRAVSGRA